VPIDRTLAIAYRAWDILAALVEISLVIAIVAIVELAAAAK
jgi:hypothetical protein